MDAIYKPSFCKSTYRLLYTDNRWQFNCTRLARAN